jgi:hypothetical protein
MYRISAESKRLVTEFGKVRVITGPSCLGSPQIMTEVSLVANPPRGIQISDSFA